MNVALKSVYFVRLKKLKGGKLAVRSKRVIPLGRSLRYSTTMIGGNTRIDAIIDHDHASGKLSGVLDAATGTITMTPEGIVLKGYFKGRNFVLLGYDLTANHTNINGRK